MNKNTKEFDELMGIVREIVALWKKEHYNLNLLDRLFEVWNAAENLK